MREWWEQAGCVPFRHGDHGLEVGLITNREGGWIFPKGTVDPGATSLEAAGQETWEEAGWEGRIDPFPLIDVPRPKFDLECRIRFFAMEVVREHDRFPETWRHRCWCPQRQVLDMIDDVAMRAAFNAWRQRDTCVCSPTLFVCRTNLGASLMSEYLWRNAVESDEWNRHPAASAGIAAEGGAVVTPLLASVLERHGIDAGPHRAQPLDAVMVDQAARLLACDENVRNDIRRRFPEAAPRCTLLNDPPPPVPDSPDPRAYEAYLAAIADGVTATLQRVRAATSP